MRRVKVVYLITGIYVGGAERLLLDTVSNLDVRQFEPVVVSLVGGELKSEFERFGVRVYDLKMSRLWPVPGLLRLWGVLRKEKPKVLHTHLIHADFFGRVLGRMMGIPVIVTTLHMVEDARRKFPVHQMDRFAAQFNTAFIAVSQKVKSDLVDLEKLDPRKIAVIRNAVADLPLVVPQKIQALRERLNVSRDQVLIGMVSRLEAPRKGHHILFAALKLLVAKHLNIKCVIVGDGIARQQLEAQVRDLGLEGHVIFAGTQHNIAEWLQAMDIFVLPSLHEGFPMAIIEAMSAARPIVATRVGGVGELVEDKREALLVEAAQVEELAEALENLVTNNELRHQLGQAARQRFEMHFKINRVVEATQHLYWQLLEKKGISPRIKLFETVTGFEPGGVQRHLEDLVGNLPRGTFQIEWVAGESQFENPQTFGLPVHRVGLVKPINPLADIRAIVQMYRLFRKHKPDIVHSHMSKAVCMASVAARLAGVPSIIGTIHGSTILERGFSVKQIIFDLVEFVALRFFAHGTISVSGATAKDLIQRGKVKKVNNITVHNGIGAMDVDIDKREIRRRLNIREDQPVILMSGRLADQKCPQALIMACAILRLEFPDLVCLIAGDGPRFEELEKLIRSNHLENIVRLLGHRSDIHAVLRGADIFVLCTWYEGLSIAVLEAMAAGLPVVATDVPGMDEVLEHGRTGYLLKENDPKECAQAIQSLLFNDQKRRQMGEAGFEKFQKQFRLSLQVARTRAFLQACGENGGVPKDFVLPKHSEPPAGDAEPALSLERE